MTCSVIGVTVVCGVCHGVMNPVHYRDLDAELWWLFWRCTTDRDHITAAVPMPAEERHQ